MQCGQRHGSMRTGDSPAASRPPVWRCWAAVHPRAHAPLVVRLQAPARRRLGAGVRRRRPRPAPRPSRRQKAGAARPPFRAHIDDERIQSKHRHHAREILALRLEVGGTRTERGKKGGVLKAHSGGRHAFLPSRLRSPCFVRSSLLPAAGGCLTTTPSPLLLCSLAHSPASARSECCRERECSPARARVPPHWADAHEHGGISAGWAWRRCWRGCSAARAPRCRCLAACQAARGAGAVTWKRCRRSVAADGDPDGGGAQGASTVALLL
jgi:hypothetical protein